MSQRGSKMRKFTFRVFSQKFQLFSSQRVFVSKCAKMSEMSWIFLWNEAKLHEKAPFGFGLHLLSGKTWAGMSFSRRVGEKYMRKSLWGEAIIWRSRGKPDLKKIPEPLNTLGRINDGRILLSGFSLRRKLKEKEKQHFFDFAPARVWTHDHRKNGKTGCQSCLRPRSHV